MRPHLKERSGTVPLVEFFFDNVIAMIQPKPHRPFIRLHTGIALDPQLYHFIINEGKPVFLREDVKRIYWRSSVPLWSRSIKTLARLITEQADI